MTSHGARETGGTLVDHSRRLETELGCPPLIRLAGKRPLDRGWTTGPRDDPDGWRSRLARHDGNVGMVCGHGLVVVDVDGYKPEAAASVDELDRRGLPATREAETGSGGRHLVYRVGRPVASGPLRGFPGVDVKADGGQVVVAPSVHPDSGRPYRWVNRVEPVLLPGWLEELLGAPAGMCTTVHIPAVVTGKVSTTVDIPAVGRPCRQNGWTVEIAIF